MALSTIDTFVPDNLFGGNQLMPVVADVLEIAQATEALVRGTLLDSSGAAVVTGSDVYAVLAEDVDTTSEAKDAPVYLTGEFNASALTVGEGEAADFKASARKVGIFLK